MTSSSSLYGTVTTQNSSSSNSTSLYGEAGTPIPDSSGNVIVRGDLYVLSGNILTTATTGNIFPANATTINLGLAATAVNIGAGTGTTTVNNDLDVAGDLTISGTFVAPDAEFGNITIAVADDNTITTTTGGLKLSAADGLVGIVGATTLYTDAVTFNLLNAPTTVNAFQSATALTIGDTGGTTTIRNDVVVQGGVTANGADFGDIQIAVADDQLITTTAGELRVSSATGIVKLEGVTALYTDTAGTFNLLNQPLTVNAFRNATALEMGEITGTTTVRNDFFVGGTAIGLAPATTISYSENNDRINRPQVQSTTGNTSGWRVAAPNATTSAIANISVFSSNDQANGKFISFQARGAATNDLRIQSGKYTAGVLGASGTVISFIDNVTAYATVNPAGPTNALDLTTKAYVDAQVDTDTTYTQNASTATGGANLNLVGSDATTDTVKFAEGTGITVSRTDANTITITNTAPDTNTTYTQNFSSTTGGVNLDLVGSDATTDTVKFADGVGVTVSYTDANTATVAIGQAVGTSDNVQFGSVRTPTINANGGVSFVNTGPGGGTYATINQFGPANTDDLTTVGYVNSILPTVVTYTQDASVASGGANLNLTGSNATVDTIKFAGGTNVTVTATDANTITIDAPDTNTTYDFAATSATGGANLILTGSDATTDTVKISNGTGVTVAQVSGTEVSVAIGQDVATSASPTFVGVTATGNITTAGAGANRFTRTAAGTGNTIPLILNRNRTDGARANNNGPWLAFEYQGTDNTQATSPIAAVRSQYDTTGRNYLELLELAGSYSTGVQAIARFKRGDYFFKSTTGLNSFQVDDDNTTISSQVATAGFQNVLFLNKRRTDVTAPTNGDLADFRIAFQGSVGNAISVGKFEGEYDATNGHKFSTNVYDATGTTSIAAVESSQKETIIAGIPTAGGAPAAIATFNRDNIVLGGTTGTTSGDKIIYSRQYISAYDSTDQTNPVANAENLMVFGTTDINNGISIVTNGTALTRITMSNAGIYNIQFSAQLSQTSGGSENAYIWLKKNGTSVANTTGDTRVSGNGDLIMAAWNYVVSAAAGDYFELAWAATNTSVILDAIAAAGVVPAIPSVILTVVPVGA